MTLENRTPQKLTAVYGEFVQTSVKYKTKTVTGYNIT